MKSSIIELTLIVLLFSVCGCTKTEINTDMEHGIPPKKTVTLDVKVYDEKTKTALGEKQENGSYSMIWSEGDEIAVINNGRLFKFTINAEDAGKQSATFSCEDGYYFDETKEIIAYYPYNAVTYSYGKIYCDIPYNQVYTANSFDKNAMHMVAKRAAAKSSPLTFNNLFGILKLRINGGDFNRLVGNIKIGSSSPLTHSSSVLNTTSLKVEIPEDGLYNLNLECNNNSKGIGITNTTDFMIVIPAGEQILGVLINTYTSTGSFDKGYYKRTTSYKNIVGGQILTMPAIDLSNSNTRKHMEVQNWTYSSYSHYYETFSSSSVYGRMIGYTLWANVNIESSVNKSNRNYNYPGNLYQWGRKDGMYGAKKVEGRFDLNSGTPAADTYYTAVAGDWCTPSYDQMWNQNTEEDKEINPIKSSTDPCPNGWRVPTGTELGYLMDGNYAADIKYTQIEFWSNDSQGYIIQNGYGFSGKADYENAAEKSHNVILPYGGLYANSKYEGNNILPYSPITRFSDAGYYWSSTPASDGDALCGKFCTPIGANSFLPGMDIGDRYKAMQIRCVKE